MIPTIVLGYLAIRTAETERLLVWEKLEESYTSLADAISNELDDMLSAAEDDLQNSLNALPAYNKRTLRRLAHRLESRHEVIGQVFFLNASGSIIFPEDPRKEWQKTEAAYEKPAQEEKDTFQYYLAEAERQEFKHNNVDRAIYEYQRMLDHLKYPVYRVTALNSIARCCMKLQLNQKAVRRYGEIIDKYSDTTGDWAKIPAIAYLQKAAIHEDMGELDAATETLVRFYTNLAENRWNLDANEMSYFADRAQQTLLSYKDRANVEFSDLSDGFAEIDANVISEVKLRHFLGDYEHLAAEEMAEVASSIAESSGSIEHLTKYTSAAGPYLLSYLADPSIETDSKPISTGIVAGFEVNLEYLSSQGFRDILGGFNVEDDIILAILDEDNRIIEATTARLAQRMDYDDVTPAGKPIAVVSSSSLPFWKVGIYVKDPLALEDLSERRASLRVFLIIGLVLAIAFGIYLSLREARREAELARLRSDFVANVSHELRTPLSSIQIFSETLKQNKVAGQDKQEQYLDTIASESNRLARLVDNVLDFSRLERSAKDFSFQPTNIGAVVASAVEAYRFYAEQRGAAINLDMAPDLPEIPADKEAISQVVMNLIDNAVKYSGNQAEITIKVFPRGQEIIVQIADKGVGIDEEDMKKIFDKFYRGKNAADLGTGGTGLGLTLAKAVAVAHGGDILVRSKKGEGSRFSVVLPINP